MNKKEYSIPIIEIIILDDVIIMSEPTINVEEWQNE